MAVEVAALAAGLLAAPWLVQHVVGPVAAAVGPQLAPPAPTPPAPTSLTPGSLAPALPALRASGQPEAGG